jgi:hypothetical protein
VPGGSTPSRRDAVRRYGLRVHGVASLMEKHGNSVTNWASESRRLEGTDRDLKSRIHGLDGAIWLTR